MEILKKLIFKHAPIIWVSFYLSISVIEKLGIDNWFLRFAIFLLLEIFIHWRVTEKPPTSEILAVILIFLCACFVLPEYLDKKEKPKNVHELTFNYEGDTPAQIMYVLNDCDATTFTPHKIHFGEAHQGKNEVPIKANLLRLDLMKNSCVKVSFFLVPSNGTEKALESFTFER